MTAGLPGPRYAAASPFATLIALAAVLPAGALATPAVHRTGEHLC